MKGGRGVRRAISVEEAAEDDICIELSRYAAIVARPRISGEDVASRRRRPLPPCLFGGLFHRFLRIPRPPPKRRPFVTLFLQLLHYLRLQQRQRSNAWNRN